MTRHWKAILGVCLVFLLGGVAGWIGATVVYLHATRSILQQGTGGLLGLLERRLTRTLSLDSSQQAQLHQIFTRYGEQRRQLQTQIQPSIRDLNYQTYQNIMEILRPEQQETFKKNVETMHRRWGAALGEGDAAAPQPVGATNQPAVHGP